MYKSPETSSDDSLDKLSSAGFHNPSAQRTSGDKITEVEITPYFSQHKSAVRTKHSSKSSSVKNHEEAGGFEDGRQSAPTKHEDFRPVRLRTNDRRKKHKVDMKKFIMRRAVRKSDDLEPHDSSGISQGDIDVSSLVRQTVKRGKDVALNQAKKTVAHNPEKTTPGDMNKLLKMAMLWKREHRVPSHKMKTSWDTGSILDASSLEEEETSIGDDPLESNMPSSQEVVNLDSSVLQSTQSTSVTNVPYVTKPSPPPHLTNLPLEEIYDIPTSAAQTHSANSAEPNPNMNLRVTELTTIESVKSDSAETGLNRNLVTPALTTFETSKLDSAERKTSQNLPTTESTTASGKSDSTKPKENTAESTTAGTVKSDSTKPKLNLNLYTAESRTVESVKSLSMGPDSELNLPDTGPSNFVKSQDIPEEDPAEETTNEESTRNNREEPWRHKQPRASRQERSPHRGTSTKLEVSKNVHPAMGAPYSSGLRWNVALERRDTGDSEKEKHSKKKKKRNSHSGTKDPADSGSPIIVGGVIGGLFILMAIVTCFIQLW